MESDSIALKTLSLATVGLIIIEALAKGVIGQGWLDHLTGAGVARLLDIAWMGLIISRSPQGWAQVGLIRENWRLGLFKALTWSAGFGAAAFLGWIILHAAGHEPLRFLHPSPPPPMANLSVLFVVGGLIAPIAEEIYFRGLLFGYCRRWGFWPALGVSTLIFALLHAGAAAFSIVQIVGGLVFATAYEIEKKLLVPIVIHVLGNLALFCTAYIFRF